MANVIFGDEETVYNLIWTGACTTKDGSWKKFWLRKSGRQWPAECCIWGCKTSPTDGAHVKINNESGYYILPMCHKCNTSKLNQKLRVNANSVAVPVLKEDTDETEKCYKKKKLEKIKTISYWEKFRGGS